MKRVFWKRYFDPAANGGGGKTEAQERADLLAEIKKQQDESLALRGFVTKPEAEEAVKRQFDEAFKDVPLEQLRDMLKGKGALELSLRHMAEQIQKLQDQGQQIKKISRSFADQIRAAYEQRAAELKTFREEKKGMFEFEINLREAATMLVSTHTGNNNAYIPTPEILPGFVDLARQKAFLENYVNVSGTSKARIVWTNKVNPEGNAAFIGEGDVKPLVSFGLESEVSNAKKVADKIKVSEEMIDDVEFMAGEIENELRYLVDIKVDDQLLSGDGLGDNLKGITEYVGGYVQTGIETTEPNNADAILAAGAQIANANFTPNRAFISIIDAANMDLQKATDGHYVLPPFASASGRIIKGIPVVETNRIPVGHLLILDTTKYKVRNYKSFTIRYGWVNDDFEKNLITVIGERRLHAYMSDNETASGVYDTFANIKAAILSAGGGDPE